MMLVRGGETAADGIGRAGRCLRGGEVMLTAMVVSGSIETQR